MKIQIIYKKHKTKQTDAISEKNELLQIQVIDFVFECVSRL